MIIVTVIMLIIIKTDGVKYLIFLSKIKYMIFFNNYKYKNLHFF